jgi:hypothetical protein
MFAEVDSIFENLPKMLSPEQVGSILNRDIKTIYDWHYRQKQRKVPEGLFVKFNRRLFLRTEILKRWIASQNSSLA